MLTIYHNPRCSKSRQTLELLEAKGFKPRVIEYLKNPPSPKELNEILIKLHLEPRQIIRSQEEAYQSLGLNEKTLDRSSLLEILSQNPILMERPIVVNNSKAAIGRPPEKVLEIL